MRVRFKNTVMGAIQNKILEGVPSFFREFQKEVSELSILESCVVQSLETEG